MVATQLDLLAPAAERIEIVPTRDVLYRGAIAAGVPQHEHVPSLRPKALRTDEEWLLALRVAEGQIRWRSWTQPRPLPLDEKPRDCVGGARNVWYDGKGVAVGTGAERRYATWALLLRGLRDQRHCEPHIADARDLAHAYHALDQYDRFYVRDGGSVVSDDLGWRERVAIPHLTKLREIVTQLGGHPEISIQPPTNKGLVAAPDRSSE